MKIVKAAYRKDDAPRVIGIAETEEREDIRMLKKLYSEVTLVDPEEFFSGCSSDDEKIRLLVRETRISAGEPEELAEGHFLIHVEWGDWKHDHGFLDSLMSKMGYVCISENVTDEDGSDCYSADHIYERRA